jgi:hypothetical protein
MRIMATGFSKSQEIAETSSSDEESATTPRNVKASRTSSKSTAPRSKSSAKSKKPTFKYSNANTVILVVQINRGSTDMRPPTALEKTQICGPPIAKPQKVQRRQRPRYAKSW